MPLLEYVAICSSLMNEWSPLAGRCCGFYEWSVKERVSQWSFP